MVAFIATPKLTKLAVASLSAAVVTVAPLAASASSGHCTTLPHTYTTDNAIEYRINIESFDNLKTLGSTPGARRARGENAVVMAAETWNHQANSRTFRRGPNTLEDDPDCEEGWSLISVRDDSWGSTDARAVISPWCEDAGEHEQFKMLIMRKDKDGEDFDWSVGNIGGPDEWDLAGVVTHEFGHALNLQHPWANGHGSVMQTDDATTSGTTRQRDLYAWDLNCLVDLELAEHRDYSAYFRAQNSDGTLTGPLWDFSGSWPVSQVSAGATWHTSSQTESAAYKREDCTAWTRAFNTSNTECTGIDERVGIGPTEATWRESESVDRIFYSDWEEVPMWEDDGRHPVRYLRSSTGFQTSTSGSLRACSLMTDWMSCSFYLQPQVYSGKQMAFAWDSWRGRTISAWAHQTREDDAVDRQLRISIGYIEQWLLPEPDDIGVQTSIPPAVACGGYLSAGSYDCVVAFVNQANSTNDIRTRRFWSGQCQNRYCLNLDPNTYLMGNAVRTGAPLALWYNDSIGKYFILHRSERPGDFVDLWESPDGASWSFVETLSDSGVGLSAPSYLEGADYVVYAK